MKNYYDVVIVGAGPMGYFTAYELVEKNKDISVLLIDKGNDLDERNCPVLEKKLRQCPKDIYGNSGCKPSCSITCGFGGSGAFSDGKFNITNEFGGWLDEYLDSSEVLELIKYVDNINLKHGAPEDITNPSTKEVYEIEKRGIAVGLKLLRSEVRHLGTEINIKILKSINKYMSDRVDYLFKTEVKDIITEDGIVKGVKTKKGQIINAKYVVLGVGRTGSFWLSNVLKEHGIKMTSNRVDVGVRVETNNIIMDEINEYLYEGKFVYNTSVGTQVRTFCSNPSGHVVIENNDGIITCNGHSYHDISLGSKNTNFALLVSHTFDTPFNDPNEYAKEISRLANKLSGGGVIVQKFGDILKGRRSTAKRIQEGFVKPTLKDAIPGDLGLILPYNTMKSLVEMVQALDHVTPGIASDHTLFYGVEAKFYSDRVEVTNEFETKIKGLFVGGDGAGITRGLSQAGANGIKIARNIIERENR